MSWLKKLYKFIFERDCIDYTIPDVYPQTSKNLDDQIINWNNKPINSTSNTPFNPLTGLTGKVSDLYDPRISYINYLGSIVPNDTQGYHNTKTFN